MLKNYLLKLLSLLLLLPVTAYMSAQSAIQIDPPSPIAGTYYTGVAVYSGTTFGQSGEIVAVDDNDLTDVNGDGIPGTATDGCQAIVNDVSGKIALIDRGECALNLKAVNAQDAGAIAVIICQVAPGAQPFLSLCNPCLGVDIPVMIMSEPDCQVIKMAMAAGSVTATVVGPTDNETAVAATDVSAGTPIVAPDITTGYGNVFTGATHGLWYKYTVGSAGVATISSCGGGANTRLIVIPGNDPLEMSQFIFAGIYGASIDDCDDGNGNFTASEFTLTCVEPGEVYYIHWDNAQSTSGFTWQITEEAAPDINAYFTVDMQNEIVDPAGVFIAGNFTGGTPQPMTDNGDGTWSYVASLATCQDVAWIFLNGNTPEDNPDLAACRYTFLFDISDVDFGTVCFNSCSACPPTVSCPNWIDDDFETYSLGGISGQSSNWTTWTPNSPGEDAAVTNALALSGTQSLLITAGPPAKDQLLLLGDRTTGNYVLKWKMYVPTANGAYYNLQKFQNMPGGTNNSGFSCEVYFNVNGSGVLHAGVANAATFTYPKNKWFEVYQAIDLDNDLIRLWIDGVRVYEWPISWRTTLMSGTKQLGSVDFYGGSNVLYYLDDVLFKEVEGCAPGAIICDGLDGYDLGALNPQSPWWSTFTANQADDGTVTNEEFLSCEQALKITDADPDDVLLVLGNRTAGKYFLSWNMYVPTGKGAYYNIGKKETAGTAAADFSIQVDMLPDGNVVMDVGAPGSVTFQYPHDEWFNVWHIYDLDNNYAELYVNFELIAAWPANWSLFSPTGIKQIGSVDFYGNTNNLYYVDDVWFVRMPSAPGDICAGAINLNPYLGQGIGTVTSTPLYDNTFNSTTVFDPPFGYECFGEPDGSATDPELNNTIWFTFTGDGETYFISTDRCNATDYIDAGDTQIAIYSGNCTNLTPVDCNEDIIPQPVPNEFPAGLELETQAGVTYYMMIDGFNFQGLVSDGQFCIVFEQLTGAIPTVDVTFRVDMSQYIQFGGVVSPAGMHIGGSFNGWTPANTPMTNVGNNVWQAVVAIPVNTQIFYKYVNGNNWGSQEGSPGFDHLQACGVDDGNGGHNRTANIGTTNTTLGPFCYNYCVPCNLVGTEDASFAASLGIQPNPAGDATFITYNFPVSNDLNIRLVNSLGQVLLQRHVGDAITGSLRLDLSNLPSGAYSVVFTDGKSVATKRLIVE